VFRGAGLRFLGHTKVGGVRRPGDDHVGPYFLADRTVDLAAAQESIDAVAIEVGVATTQADTSYAAV
jgi:hypothetical protein